MNNKEPGGVEAAEGIADIGGSMPPSSDDTNALVPDSAVSAAPESASPLPGELLAARRIELRLSVEDVSATIKLAPRQIRALEMNDFGVLPGATSVRGFIRAYAKLLELDPEPLLASVAGELKPAAAQSELIRRPLPSPAFNARRYAPLTSHRRGTRGLVGLAAVVLVFVGTLAFVAKRNGWSSLPEANVPVPTVVAAQQPDMLAGAAPADLGSAALLPTNLLELTLREDAWVEIATVDGERKLLSRLLRAGTRQTLEIPEAVTLVVGNASGVDAALRGEPLNLKAVARDNVVKLNLK